MRVSSGIQEATTVSGTQAVSISNHDAHLAGITPPDDEGTHMPKRPRAVWNECRIHSVNPSSQPPRPESTGIALEDNHSLDFSSTLNLVCPIDAEGISNRWLNPFVPAPGQKPKAYDPTITSFIHRMLNSYASVAVNGRGIPPFVHPLQLERPSADDDPLQTCFNIVRLLDRPPSGSTTTPHEILAQEMTRLFSNRHTYTHTVRLAALQASLLYALALYFSHASPSDPPTMTQPMVHLQELASLAAKQGIVSQAETQHLRPKWESWILVEAKRRAIYTMYLFDGLLSARDGLPSFLGTELAGLPAPACQSLWDARERQVWERRYDVFLAQWPEGYLTIDELWPTPQEFDEAASHRRSARVDHWLEDVDKFGTMMFAITSYIHKN